MTVQQAIKWLQELPDKQLEILIHCPYCGRGNQLAKMEEVVILFASPDVADVSPDRSCAMNQRQSIAKGRGRNLSDGVDNYFRAGHVCPDDGRLLLCWSIF